MAGENLGPEGPAPGRPQTRQAQRRILVNYADRRLYRAQRYNTWTALTRGGLTHHAAHRRADLDQAFVAANQGQLAVRRGAGLWLWKPYVILETLRRSRPGDAVVYSDSGAVFLGSVEPLVQICYEATPGILGFDLGALVERHWTKRDGFVLMGCDRPEFHQTPQLTASFALFIAGRASIGFVEQWLAYAEDPRLLGDSPSVCGQPELPGFCAHRHDQSIFSLLYKSWGLRSGQQLAPGALDDVIRITRVDPPLASAWRACLAPRWWRRIRDPGPPAQPRAARVLWQRGRALIRTGDLDGAIATLEGLLEMTGEQGHEDRATMAASRFWRASVHERLALCHFRRHEFARAEAHYASAHDLLPARPDNRIKRMLCTHLGNPGSLAPSHGAARPQRHEPVPERPSDLLASRGRTMHDPTSAAGCDQE